MVATKKVLKPWVKALIIILILAAIGVAGYFIYDYIQSIPEIEQGTIKNVEIEEEVTAEEGQYITSNEDLVVLAIDVGMGQSLFADYGETEVLIDAGYPEYGKKVSKAIKKYVDGPLDYVIATHSHEDHVGGLEQIYKDYDVPKTIFGDIDKDNKTYMSFYNTAKADGEVVEDSDTVIELGKNATLTIYDVTDGDENTNNNSVITLIQHGENYFFASGDAEEPVEVQLKGNLPVCDVVFAGHHGSSTSNTLIPWLDPSYFVISAGSDNEYGHPHKEVLEEALNYTYEVYGTWKSGTIKFTSDGLSVSCNADEADRLTVSDKGAK